MNSKASQLFWDILNCAGKSFSNKTSPCNLILSSQRRSQSDFHLPEPWDGHISEAEILFVGPNPRTSLPSGLQPGELFPCLGDPYWGKDIVEDFFENRFDSSHRDFANRSPYTGINSLGIPNQIQLTNGVFVNPKTKYWPYAHHIASFELGKSSNDTIPGIDYAMTEIVRCKSVGTTDPATRQSYIRQSYPSCKRFLGATLDLAENARKIIVLGTEAGDAVFEYYRSLNRNNFLRFSSYADLKTKYFPIPKYPSFNVCGINGEMLTNKKGSPIEVIFAYHSSAHGKQGTFDFYKQARQA